MIKQQFIYPSKSKKQQKAFLKASTKGFLKASTINI